MSWLTLRNTATSRGGVHDIFHDAELTGQLGKMESRLAVISGPEACGSEEECLRVCPDEAIEMRWVELDADLSVGRWREATAEALAPTLRSA